MAQVCKNRVALWRKTVGDETNMQVPDEGPSEVVWIRQDTTVGKGAMVVYRQREEPGEEAVPELVIDGEYEEAVNTYHLLMGQCVRRDRQRSEAMGWDMVDSIFETEGSQSP